MTVLLGKVSRLLFGIDAHYYYEYYGTIPKSSLEDARSSVCTALATCHFITLGSSVGMVPNHRVVVILTVVLVSFSCCEFKFYCRFFLLSLFVVAAAAAVIVCCQSAKCCNNATSDNNLRCNHHDDNHSFLPSPFNQLINHVGRKECRSIVD